MTKLNIPHNKDFIVSKFILTLVFVYIILFEFILPINKVLPKPSVLIDSFPTLIYEYHFVSKFLFTFAMVYLAILISFLLISLFSNILIKIIKNFPLASKIFVIGKFFIPLFLIFLFEQWFNSSTYGQYLFVFILVMGYLKISFFNSYDLMKDEYIISARSLGLTESAISKKVIWKSIQPYLFRTVQENHIFIWSFVIIYEFICQTDGIGTALITAVKYNDFSIIILIIIFVILAFYLMELILNKVKQKFFFWN